MNKIYIFGHRNPDTDSVTATISYAYLKETLGYTCDPRILGEINPETKYVLKSFNIETPKYLNDVKLQVKDLKYRKGCFIDINESIFNAYRYMMNKDISSVPVVEESLFSGILSMKDITTNTIYQSTKLYASYDHILETIEGERTLRFNEFFDLNILTTFQTSENFLNTTSINEKICLITGDRQNIIDYAIKNHVGLIILVDNTELKKSSLDLAQKNKTNIIKTKSDSLKVIKNILYANSIRTVNYVKDIVCFDEEMTVDDVYENIKMVHHNYYPVIKLNKKCLGLLKVSDLNDYEAKKVILVDHNEQEQSAEGLKEAEILEIIDHHKIGSIDTDLPINFRNMTVGSTNTIIYDIYKEYNVKIPSKIAGLMASGIISDTLLLKSPTTTQSDVKALNELASLAKIDYEKFGLEMFKMGSIFADLTPEEIIFHDFKTFEIDNKKVGIGQALTTEINEFLKNKKKYVTLLDKLSYDKDFHVIALFITDIVNESSFVFYNNSAQQIFDFCFNTCEQGKCLPGIISRKKQIIPSIMKAMGHK